MVLDRADEGEPGLTIWLQNPYRTPATVIAGLAARDEFRFSDRLAVTLGPLEIGRLSIPLQQTEDLELQVSSQVAGSAVRVRSLEPSNIQLGETLRSVAGALAAAMTLGVGRYSIHRTGGLVQQPAKFELPFAGGRWVARQPVKYERVFQCEPSDPPLLYYGRSKRRKNTYAGWGLVLAWAIAAVGGLATTFGVGGLLEVLGLAASDQAREKLVVLVLAAGVVGGFILYFATRSYGVRRGWVEVRQRGSQLGQVEGAPVGTSR